MKARLASVIVLATALQTSMSASATVLPPPDGPSFPAPKGLPEVVVGAAVVGLVTKVVAPELVDNANSFGTELRKKPLEQIVPKIKIKVKTPKIKKPRWL